MTISQANALNEIATAMANGADRIVIDKASIASQTAGRFCSLFRAAGVPGQGAIPVAAAVCTKALLGAMGFTNSVAPVDNYLAWAAIVCGNAGQGIEIHDRLAHMGGLSGVISPTPQNVLLQMDTIGVSADRIGDDVTYSDVQWWLEWYADTGATVVNVTLAVTYHDDTTANINVATTATMRAGNLLPIVSTTPGKFIKRVNTAALTASTGTAGNFGVTATRPRTAIETDLANKTKKANWMDLGIPEIPNDSCLTILMPCITTTSGTVRGQGKIIHV